MTHSFRVAHAAPESLQTLGVSVAGRRGAADGDIARWRVPVALSEHLLIPLLLFAAANLWLLGFDGDRWLAGRLYAWEGGQWALRDNFWTTTVIHVAGKHLSTAAWLLLAAFAVLAWRRRADARLRRPLFRLLTSVVISTSVIAWLKHSTHMDCPWDASQFGGVHPYFGLFDARPAHLKPSGCFPAGHASAGYAWIALYFFFAAVRPAWRWAGLGIGLGAGLIFGVSQQLRGAHFLSHDVWTLMICWLVALSVHGVSIRWSTARAARHGGGYARLRAALPELPRP